MSALALALVLLAAVSHASWNFSAKVAAEAKHFIWLYSAGSMLVYGPIVIAVLLVERPEFESRHWLALGATSVLHLLYSLSLQRGYRHSDLSVVYPIARGTGPLLSFAGAAWLLGEAVTARSLLGIAFRMLVLAPRAWRDRERVALEARTFRKPVIIVSVLGPLGYILVLFAMRLAPVSHVAPARELSTLVGAWVGSRLLREHSGPWRIIGAALIVAGVIALSLRT
jgi:drug/metabolite transporter (DMT)-like permease